MSEATNLDDGAFSPGLTRYLVLADGRRLAYTEWGEPAGKPVLEFRGLPTSRKGDAIDMETLVRARVRRITIDRPGLGHSDPQQGRTLLDWPADVRELANALGLDSFAVLGTSGGGPYAAACGYALPDQVSHVVLVSGLGPLDRAGALIGMNGGEARTMALARRLPLLARWLVGAAMTAERVRPGLLYQGLMRALPPADRRVAAQLRVRESLIDSYTLAFRQGMRAEWVGPAAHAVSSVALDSRLK